MANIAIDMTSTPKNKTGIGRYIKNLVENLQVHDVDNQYFLLIHDDDLDCFEIKNTHFKVIPVNSKWLRKTYVRILWEQFVLPFRLKQLHIDLLHSPNFTLPYFSAVKKVVSFHDLTYFFLPGMHTPLKRELFKAYIRLSAYFSDQILTISETSAVDIQTYLPFAFRKVSVTPLGAAAIFHQPNSFESMQDILKKYQISKQYILYVGTIEPRKNILNLVKAYELLSPDLKDRYALVIAGKRGWMYDSLFDYCAHSPDTDRILFTGFVEDAHLPALYRNASLFAYVSHYEGFGIPLVESMASQTPFVTSNKSSMKEIAEDAALLADPDSPPDISHAMERLLTNEVLQAQLKSEFPNKLALYNWNNCAKTTLTAYKKALAGDCNDTKN